MGGVDLQNPEFSRFGNDETKLFVIDKQRSWGNHIDWGVLAKLLEPEIRNATVTTIGNSMGGFLAVLSADPLGATTAIAFAPQWSIDPNVIAHEPRWSKYRKKIRQIHIADLSSAFKGKTKFHVFFGEDQLDAVHKAFFCQQDGNVDTFTLRGCEHNVAQFLKQRNQLYPLIHACRRGQNVMDWMLSEGIEVAGNEEHSTRD